MVRQIQQEVAAGQDAVFAIRRDGDLLGMLGLHLKLKHERASLGYWIGAPYWGCGYTTEAGWEVLWWGFETWGAAASVRQELFPKLGVTASVREVHHAAVGHSED